MANQQLSHQWIDLLYSPFPVRQPILEDTLTPQFSGIAVVWCRPQPGHFAAGLVNTSTDGIGQGCAYLQATYPGVPRWVSLFEPVPIAGPDPPPSATVNPCPP